MGDYDMRPSYQGLFIRPTIGSHLEAAVGRWGLVSGAATDRALALSTFNARDDRVQNAPTYMRAWRRGQRCLIPAEAIYEPDWRQRYQVPTRFNLVSGESMMLAGIWDKGVDTFGAFDSYSMLTINADDHDLFKHYHRQNEEKRMVVVLPEAAWGVWLLGPTSEAIRLLRPVPAQMIVATPEPEGNALNLSLF